MLKIIICEDDKNYLDTITDYVKNIIANNKEWELVCAVSNTEEIEDADSANVFLLDIDLKASTTGYDFARKLQHFVDKKYIVFISEHMEYLLQSFKVRAFDFLPKPVTKNILEKCLLDINDDMARWTSPRNKQIQVKTGSNVFFINEDEIVYIEKFGNKSVVHSAGSMISCYESLESFEKRLDSIIFIRCHKSFIVNKRYISEVRLNSMEVLFITGHKCYVGRKYKERLLGNV